MGYLWRVFDEALMLQGVTAGTEPLFDSTPSETETPEERHNLNPIPDKVLRRTNPKRYDTRHDWYIDTNESGEDSPISNRYDNPIPAVASLEKSAWKVYPEHEWDPKDPNTWIGWLVRDTSDNNFPYTVVRRVSNTPFSRVEGNWKRTEQLAIEQAPFMIPDASVSIDYIIPLRYIGLQNTASLDELDWEIERTVEASTLQKTASSISIPTFVNLLVSRAKMYKRTLAKLLFSKKDIVPYSKFPGQVKEFVRRKFADEYDKVKDKLERVYIEFEERPKDRSDKAGCEYFPDTNSIAWYLGRDELEKHWDGVVHELVHAIQSHFQGTDPTIQSPPDNSKLDYYSMGEGYEKDPAEQQAYTIGNEFKRQSWKTNPEVVETTEELVKALQPYQIWKARRNPYGGRLYFCTGNTVTYKGPIDPNLDDSFMNVGYEVPHSVYIASPDIIPDPENYNAIVYFDMGPWKLVSYDWRELRQKESSLKLGWQVEVPKFKFGDRVRILNKSVGGYYSEVIFGYTIGEVGEKVFSKGENDPEVVNNSSGHQEWDLLWDGESDVYFVRIPPDGPAGYFTASDLELAPPKETSLKLGWKVSDYAATGDELIQILQPYQLWGDIGNLGIRSWFLIGADATIMNVSDTLGDPSFAKTKYRVRDSIWVYDLSDVLVEAERSVNFGAIIYDNSGPFWLECSDWRELRQKESSLKLGWKVQEFKKGDQVAFLFRPEGKDKEYTAIGKIDRIISPTIGISTEDLYVLTAYWMNDDPDHTVHKFFTNKYASEVFALDWDDGKRVESSLKLATNYIDENEKMFQGRFNTYGEDGPNIFWSSKEAQRARFEVLSKIADLEGKLVLDVGCGYGDLVDYFKDEGIHVGKYVGVDVVQDIVDVAKKKHLEVEFETRDLLTTPYPENSFDYILGSGIFALSGDDWEKYVGDMLGAMLGCAKGGVGVNFLKGTKDSSSLHKADPLETLLLVEKHVKGKVILVEGYLPDDFTIFIFKESEYGD